MACKLNESSSKQLRLTPNLHPSDGFNHARNLKQLVHIFNSKEDDVDDFVGTIYDLECSDGYTRTFVIKGILHHAEGSIVVEVECICTRSGCEWHGVRKVMKISYSSRNQTSEEEELIREARLKAESTGNRWALNHLPNILDSIALPYDKTTVQRRFKKPLKEQDEDCVMRVTLLDKLQPLSELDNARELAQVFYDILQIHQWLHECPGILHRDISMGNIMFRRIDGKVYGVLNDFDLSSRLQDMDKDPTSKQRTGTRPFMSHELLDSCWQGGHCYRHDLESLFYVVLCMACRYESPGVATVEPRAYSEWFRDNDYNVLVNKYFFLTGSRPTIATQAYFAGFKRWLISIHRSMRCGYIELAIHASGELDTDHEQHQFDWTTLNNCVTYAKMRSVMSSFDNQSLETHWAGWNSNH
ncbi:protein kinase [Lentinula raphanica]|uniref:Protein kinase n=1 Tax=Lentinula raphanica TaxID=153919 RepID=A0AA38U7I2_9AGAR|nr:protein kinase [Lentinula raphanica]KAJ3833611.1 protein kinase [Lentinula raphanica]